jgi:hypothetical protein
VKGLGVLEDSPLSTTDRAWIIASAYLRSSKLYLLVRAAYQGARDRLTPFGVPVPRWRMLYPRVSSLNALRVARTVEEELRQAAPGRVVVAHLLVPHDPYVFDEQCRLKPVAAWENTADLGRSSRANTAEERLRRYEAYTAQTRCLYVVLGRLLDAIPEQVRAQSTMVVHGDHGSRIVRHDPEAPGRRVTPADLVDDHSTLFAIHSPRARMAGSDDLLPLPCLVKASLVDQGPFSEALAACRGTPRVYLAGAGTFAPYPGSDAPSGEQAQ